MGAVTLNGVQDGIAAALRMHFPDAEVYTETVEGGYQGPCFFVKLQNAAHAQELNSRYRRTHTFDLQYYAADKSNRAMLDAADRLYDVMETVVLDGTACRGTGMRHEIADEVLHFYVDYRFLLYRPAADDPVMGTLEREGDLKR